MFSLLSQISVRICPTFWLFLFFFSRLYAQFSIENGILAAVLLVSLLVHEYGHAITALYFGAKPSITLEAFGGRTEYNRYKVSSKQRFWITLNGPLLESSLILIPYLLLKSGVFAAYYYAQYALVATMHLNLIWCLLNLVPIIPLDGGYLLGYLLERKYKENSAKISSAIGLFCTAILVPCLYYYNFFFFATVLLFLGWQNFQILRSFGTASQFSRYSKALKAMEENDLKQAKGLLKKLIYSKDVKIKNAAVESLAKLYFQENKQQKSYDLLLQVDQDSLSEGKYLLCKLAFAKKNYQVVTKYSRQIYEAKPSYEIAALNSQAFAGLADAYYAGAWLATAAQFGPQSRENARQLLLTPLYDVVRDQEEFLEEVKDFIPVEEVAAKIT